jgi:hypothetical protein
MFDLERAIGKWRQQMLAAGIKTPVPLEELESHLRDDVEQQIRTGLGARKAFRAGVKRLGQADPLTEEFAKDQVARYQKIGTLILAIFATIFSLFHAWLLNGSKRTPIVRFEGYFIIAVTAIWIVGQVYLLAFLHSVLSRERIRVIAIRGMVLSALVLLATPAWTVWTHGFHGSVGILGILLNFACACFFNTFFAMRMSAKKQVVVTAS